MKDERSDPELLEAIRADDAQALSTLLARHAPTIMRFATKMCRDETDAEDVLQETLLAAARNVRDLRGGAAVSTWLYTVARSFCIKKRRRRKDQPAAFDPIDGEAALPIEAPTGRPDQVLEGHEIGVALQQALAKLDDTSREVIVLRDAEGLTAAETAEVLQTSVDAVKSRLHRARSALRKALEPVLHAEPTVPSDPACPDIVDVLSRHLEGDVGPDACAAMEAHVASCGSCSHACASLREVVATCRASGGEGLSPSAEARVRDVLKQVRDARA